MWTLNCFVSFGYSPNATTLDLAENKLTTEYFTVQGNHCWAQSTQTKQISFLHTEDTGWQAFIHAINASNPVKSSQSDWWLPCVTKPQRVRFHYNLAWKGEWKINKESEPEWPLIRLGPHNPVKQPPWCMFMLYPATLSYSNFRSSRGKFSSTQVAICARLYVPA